MPLNENALYNWPFEPVVQRYEDSDVMLYALSIGIGSDPVNAKELPYVYEDGLRFFPTMLAVLGCPPPFSADPASGINRTKMVHGEQGLEILQPLPATGEIHAIDKIIDITDKGKDRGATITSRRTISDASGKELARLDSTVFCRADGGFGGKAQAATEPHAIPDRAPDFVVDMPTLPQQALLYRLNFDRNPLHADPALAARAGFERPILHGLCSWGIAAHAIVRQCCDYEADRLRRFQARFSRPVLPGDTLSVEIWQDGNEISFRGWVKARQEKVLDNGYAQLT